MIDVDGAIVLTALALTATGTLILAGPVSTVAARRLVVGAGIWLAAVTALTAAGLFSAASRVRTPAIGAAVLVPVLVVTLSSVRGSTIRRLALGLSLAALVAVNVGRLLGVFFVLFMAEGRMGPTFATYAGWGDVAVALLAIPVALTVHRRARGWRALTLAWNAVGLLDLVVAVTLGVGAAAASPLRFIYESPETSPSGRA